MSEVVSPGRDTGASTELGPVQTGGGRKPRLSLLIAPIALVSVVGVAIVGGHVSAGPAEPPASRPPAVAAVTGATASTGAGAEMPADTAGAGPTVSAASAGPRTVGGDGVISRLAFGLPPDPPVRLAERQDRFTIDDLVLFTAAGPPPWMRRSGTFPD